MFQVYTTAGMREFMYREVLHRTAKKEGRVLEIDSICKVRVIDNVEMN